VIHGKVYNVTDFLEEHPGGYDIVVSSAGVRPHARPHATLGRCNGIAGCMVSPAAHGSCVAPGCGDAALGLTAVERRPPGVGPQGVLAPAIHSITVDRCLAGQDATQDFEEIGHSNSARQILSKYFIGDFAVGAASQERAAAGSAGAAARLGRPRCSEQHAGRSRRAPLGAPRLTRCAHRCREAIRRPWSASGRLSRWPPSQGRARW
jgi:hypothetical protein